jgi:hypothetical protein
MKIAAKIIVHAQNLLSSIWALDFSGVSYIGEGNHLAT